MKTELPPIFSTFTMRDETMEIFELPIERNTAAAPLYRAINGNEIAVTWRYVSDAFHTSASTVPNSRCMSCVSKPRITPMRRSEETRRMHWSPNDAFFASCDFPAPIYWLATTAPPVARAEKMLINSTLSISTSATPDTADSPTYETCMVSITPMSMASVCSMMSGRIRRRRSMPEKGR